MKKIILIEDNCSIREYIIACIGSRYFNEENDPRSDEFCQAMRQRLVSSGFAFEEFWANKDVFKQYPDGLPENTVIVLDGDLADGSSKQIFTLFSDSAKALTIVHTASMDFPSQASKNGFSNFIHKHWGEEYQNRLGDTILEMCAN